MFFSPRWFTGWLTLLMVDSLATAGADPARQTREIDRILAGTLSADGPGAAVLVVHQGKVVHSKGYGLADLDTQAPVTPQTVFDLASASKQFTAMAIMILVEQGKLGFDDEVRKHLRDFTLERRDRPLRVRDLRVRDLLWHLSGLPDYTGDEWDGTDAEFATLTPELHLRWLNTRPSRHPPGQKYQYNNSNYALLALVVERLGGKPFAEFARDQIFRPCGMDHTFVIDRAGLRVPNRATGYKRADGRPEKSASPSIITGDGNVFTTIEDLAAWDAALRESKLVDAKTLAQAWCNGKQDNGRPVDTGSGCGYGFGWSIQESEHGLCVFHGGGWAGTATYICRYVTAGLTVVVLSNDEDADVEAVTTAIAELYGL